MKLNEILEQLKNDIAPVNKFYNTEWIPCCPNRNKMPAYIELIIDRLTNEAELWQDDNYDGGGCRIWQISYSDLINDNNHWQWYTFEK